MYYYAVSDKGAVKDVNQDSILIKKWKSEDDTVCVFGCICDGMGGLAAGEKASYTAALAYSRWFSDHISEIYQDVDQVKTSFSECSQIINQKIYSFGKENGFRLGTTVSAVLIIGNRYLTCNVGDSRVYRSFDKQFVQITKDNSYVQNEVDAGRMTKEEAETSEKNHLLTRCLGGYSVLEAVDFTSGEVIPGDKFVFCSDGARHVVTSREYAILFSKIQSKKDLVEQLPRVIEEIIRRGESDNISIGCIAI